MSCLFVELFVMGFDPSPLLHLNIFTSGNLLKADNGSVGFFKPRRDH